MEIWDNSNGLPQNAVFALEMDNHGYLWIATEEGLVRFDGISHKIFDQATYPEMLEQTYYTFFKTSGGIWATSDRSIALLEKNIQKVIDCSQITENTWIRAVAEDGSGGILIGTQSGKIHVWNNNNFSSLSFWNPENQVEILSFFPLENSKILVGTNRGLYELDLKSQGARLVSSEDFGVQKVFGSIHSIYISSANSGIYRLKENYEMEKIISPELIKDINPSSLSTDAENRIWAGSTEKGLILIENGIISRFTYPELENYTTRKIIKGKENLYLGTLGKGLAIIRPVKVNQLNFEVLKEKNIKAIFQGGDSSIWIGTRSDGLHRIKGGKIQSLTVKDGLVQNGVTTIGSSKGKIYSGSQSGISVIDINSGKVIDKLTQEDGLKSNYIYAVYSDSGDWLWILTRYGGIHYFDENGIFHQVELPEKFSNTNFSSILELKNKQIIVGSMNQGIFTIENGHFVQNQTLPLTPGEDVIYCIYQDESDDLWFGTHGGMVLLRDGKFKSLKKSNGLKSQSVYSITSDGLNGVWISNNFGVQYFSNSELQRFKETTDKDFFIATTLYNKSMGMPNSEANGLIFPASIKDFSGKIWIPTVEGVGVIDPSNSSDKSTGPANFLWDELHIGDQKTPIENQIQIPAGVSMFLVSFSLIDFENPSQYSLFYRIDSKTDNWLPIKDQRQLLFNGLKPGNYNLEVKVLRYGKLEKVHALPIVVSAPLFQTTAFKIFIVVIFLLLVYFIVKFYFNNKLKNDLEAKVNLRTLELSMTNEKLKDAVREIADQNLILKEITWNQSHLVRAPLTKAMGINQLLIKYPNYSDVGKSKEQLEIELLETLKQLDKIVKETHSKSENLKK
ncbi:MAG: two-component regulator propeller domain-containing protein [Algoriphagus sp.]|uniref:ligand-binding sensor domain-containing protein n=1 Tax=Algoriphagus sp. TaxID=1872435 RepID=UPI002730DBB4|nr:two-component regulator propeller domain-containing protein [Algoriphagus sp.]MDP2041590.1 two-component regulator propeller domain-containing protein [Algoriphagus sp.]MDP3472553.1 two-component regulator propeller domain-containing protein [Algoriphagus sp.]